MAYRRRKRGQLRWVSYELAGTPVTPGLYREVIMRTDADAYPTYTGGGYQKGAKLRRIIGNVNFKVVDSDPASLHTNSFMQVIVHQGASANSSWQNICNDDDVLFQATYQPQWGLWAPTLTPVYHLWAQAYFDLRPRRRLDEETEDDIWLSVLVNGGWESELLSMQFRTLIWLP